MKEETKTRQSNFECMRIVSMFFIVLFHFIMPTGGNLLTYSTPIANKVLTFLALLIIVHVNSFILLTGYFGYKGKPKIKKVIFLFLEAYFYSIVISLLFKEFAHVEIDDYLSLLSPFEYQNMWFLISYSTLYLLSPYINIVIDKLKKKELEKLIILLLTMYCGISLISREHLFFNEGFSLEHFAMMYVIGAYLSKYGLPWKQLELKQKRLLYIGVFFLMAICSFLTYEGMTLVINHTTNSFIKGISMYIKSIVMNYNAPFIIIQSIAYFLFFETFTFKNKIINSLAKPLFAVYLITEQPQMVNFIYTYLKINTGTIYNLDIIPRIMIDSILIMVLCIGIDSIRILMKKLLFDKKSV